MGVNMAKAKSKAVKLTPSQKEWVRNLYVPKEKAAPISAEKQIAQLKKELADLEKYVERQYRKLLKKDAIIAEYDEAYQNLLSALKPFAVAGEPTLHLAELMPDQILLVLGYKGGLKKITYRDLRVAHEIYKRC